MILIICVRPWMTLSKAWIHEKEVPEGRESIEIRVRALFAATLDLLLSQAVNIMTGKATKAPDLF